MAPTSKAPLTASVAGGNFKHVGNKMKRQDLYREHRKNKRSDKLKRRIERAKEEKGEGGAEKKKARLETNIPRTIERTRDFNPTIISAPNTHDGPGPSTAVSAKREVVAAKTTNDEDDDDEDEGEADDIENDVEDNDDDEEDEDDPYAAPALLITTSLPSNSTSPHLASANSRSHPATRTREFVDELLNIFPGAEYRARAKAKGVGLGKIAGWARDRGYNAMLVVGEDKKAPFSLTLIGLPAGPTAFFRLTNVSIRTEIEGHARSTQHTPELILNNFTTALGHQVGALLQSLFPRIPQLEGRQVVTAHNQRDYVFFRRHRYMFKSEEKAKLQEIGPRFTLKLRSLKEGLPKGAGVWDGEIHFDGRPKADARNDDEEGGDDDDVDDDDADPAAEQEALDEINGTAASTLDSTAKAKDSRAAKRKHMDRGHEEATGLSFEWKPKMGVSRRNFYL